MCHANVRMQSVIATVLDQDTFKPTIRKPKPERGKLSFANTKSERVTVDRVVYSSLLH